MTGFRLVTAIGINVNLIIKSIALDQINTPFYIKIFYLRTMLQSMDNDFY